MFSLLKTYMVEGFIAVCLVLLGLVIFYKYKLATTEAKLAKTQIAIERITDSMNAYKELGDAQGEKAKRALLESAAISREGANTVLQTLATTDDQASREWALKRIKALEGK